MPFLTGGLQLFPINRLRNFLMIKGVALRKYVFRGVAGPPFLQLFGILPLDCIQNFVLCVAAGSLFEQNFQEI